MQLHRLFPLLLPLALASCRSLASDARILDGPTGRDVEIARAVDRLAERDVVFLGELHDSAEAHAVQLELTRGLLERRGDLALSMEMFERDVQGVLDAYLSGDIDEEAFLAEARPWSNYAEHYRPAVELARERGLVVLAANVPRPLAGRVASEGLDAIAGEEHVPRAVDAGPGRYRERFEATMAGHGELDAEDMARYFAAQCLKDDAMAESIADFLEAAGGDAPLVVHWCGRFHSDHGLGTVERLLARRPDLAVAVVTTVRDEEPEEGVADLVVRVP